MERELWTIINFVLIVTFFVADILFLIFEPNIKGSDLMISQILVCILMYAITLYVSKKGNNK